MSFNVFGALPEPEYIFEMMGDRLVYPLHTHMNQFYFAAEEWRNAINDMDNFVKGKVHTRYTNTDDAHVLRIEDENHIGFWLEVDVKNNSAKGWIPQYTVLQYFCSKPQFFISYPAKCDTLKDAFVVKQVDDPVLGMQYKVTHPRLPSFYLYIDF